MIVWLTGNVTNISSQISAKVLNAPTASIPSHSLWTFYSHVSTISCLLVYALFTGYLDTEKSMREKNHNKAAKWTEGFPLCHHLRKWKQKRQTHLICSSPNSDFDTWRCLQNDTIQQTSSSSSSLNLKLFLFIYLVIPLDNDSSQTRTKEGKTKQREIGPQKNPLKGMSLFILFTSLHLKAHKCFSSN